MPNDLTHIVVGDKIGVVHFGRRDDTVYVSEVVRVTPTQLATNMHRFRRTDGQEIGSHGRAYALDDAEFIDRKRRADAVTAHRESVDNAERAAREERFGIAALVDDAEGDRFLHWLAGSIMEIEAGIQKTLKTLAANPWRLNGELRWLESRRQSSVVLEYYLYLFKLVEGREPGKTLAEVVAGYRADLTQRFLDTHDSSPESIAQGFAAREAERQIKYRAPKTETPTG